VEIITGELRTSVGRAQTRLIEACAAGNIRSREHRMASDMEITIRNLLGGTLPGATIPGPISALIWKGAVIEGDTMLDGARRRWQSVEINVADLRIDVGVAKPATSAAAIPKTGGRPSDKDLIIAEAKRRMAANGPRPPTLIEFARELQQWLNTQPNAHRNSKTGKVMAVDTIEGHIRSLWNERRER
jgi:hypothetical protein